ncbi:MAG: enoyl-CoA hydratase/isomerase family protein [Burkholderiales bacterium]|nr:enoyl-CoA hydratase/isomerase family protein [Burkholderiales bacterium]
MTSQATLSHPAPGVALVLIANPPMNFGTGDLGRQILEAVLEADRGGAAVVVLASDTPGYFIAHWSLQSIVDNFSRPAGASVRQRAPGLFDVLETLPTITIAANNGQAWGGGAELSWACDLRIAGESATYGQPEVALGILPGAGGTTRLERLVGTTRCMEIVLGCRPFGAREALAMGAINRVVPDARLREETLAWAAQIARSPRWALAAAKRAIVEGRDLPLAAARRNESQIFMETARRPEALARLRRAQAAYDAGADSAAAIAAAQERAG